MFYGLDFASKGIISVDPPETNKAFPILVPQVDNDGNELAGVKMPEISVPLATYTGWNLFNAEAGPTSLLSSMQGPTSLFPARAPIANATRIREVGRRALPESRRLPRSGHSGCAGTGETALPARRRRGQCCQRADEHWSLLFANGEK